MASEAAIFLLAAMAMSSQWVGQQFAPEQVKAKSLAAESVLSPDTRKESYLFVDGVDENIKSLRRSGARAYGVATKLDTELTDWHAIANPDAIPFPYDMFNMVFWMRDNMSDDGDKLEMLMEAAFHVMPGGVFIFSPHANIGWVPILIELGWEKLSMRFYGLDMWRRPIDLHRWFSNSHVEHWFMAAA